MTTSIEWTDATWNPVTGCQKISPGCKNCYAEGIAERFFAKQYPANADGSLRKFTDVRVHADRLGEPLHWKKPRRVFVNSMSDLFHEAVPDIFILQVLAVIAATPHHTYQVLTKRPERMQKFFAQFKNREHAAELIGFGCEEGGDIPDEWLLDEDFECHVSNSVGGSLGDYGVGWPMKNLWLGVSVESQKYADERIPLLLQTPAAIRFLSVEPLLENVRPRLYSPIHADGEDFPPKPVIDWVICGGESGPGARPFNLAWAESLRWQCKAANVAFFMKQVGSRPFVGELARICSLCSGQTAPTFDCEECNGTGVIERTIRLRDRKGGDMDEWPENLRVREFPA